MMPNPFLELPLAIFTTLMPVAAGAYFGIFLMMLPKGMGDMDRKRIARFSLVPVVLLVVGFVGAFFHLKDPLHAVFAVTNVASSPLSQEIVAACAFAVLAIACWGLETAGKMPAEARVVSFGIVSAVGFLLSVMTGLAYNVSTITPWSHPCVPIEQVGYFLMASLVGVSVSSLSVEAGDKKRQASYFLVPALGFAIAAISTLAHSLFVLGLEGSYVSGADLVAATLPYLAAALILALLALAFFAQIVLRAKKSPSIAIASCAFLVLGIFCARLAFYCLQLNVGV